MCTPPRKRSGAAIATDGSAGTVAEAYLAAFATGEPATIASFVTDDFVNVHHSALGEGCTGRVAYEARLPNFLTMFTDLRYDVVRTIAAGDAAAVEYRLRARFDGYDLDIPGVMLFDVRDGLIARRVDTWDGLTFRQQTGVS